MEQIDPTDQIGMQEAAVHKLHSTKKSSRSCCFFRLFSKTKTTSGYIQKINPDLSKYLNSNPRTPLYMQEVPPVDQAALQEYLLQRRKELSQGKIKTE